ncbi:hypothetical protein C0989_005362 [Termitomyces sp. Mn162]|nr:hypothetical protein C0989_005362 [Termitomyces sp. Mn162]
MLTDTAYSCGSGAWAIQAAQTYPEATVIAIDISPLPSRPLPSNMQFLQLNVTESLPFEPENFDIIHARFIFVHLPNWKQVLENIVSLLKPRGWLWIEDADIHFYDDGPQDLAPSLKAFNDTYLASARAKNVDPLAGSSLNAVLKSMKCFSLSLFIHPLEYIDSLLIPEQEKSTVLKLNVQQMVKKTVCHSDDFKYLKTQAQIAQIPIFSGWVK